MDTLGKRIKEVREQARLDQGRFAKRIHSGQSYVSTIEADKTQPSNKLIDLICSEFLITREWLLTGTGEMKQKDFKSFTAGKPEDLMKNEIWDFNRIMYDLKAKAEPEEFNKLLGMIYELYISIRKK